MNNKFYAIRYKKNNKYWNGRFAPWYSNVKEEYDIAYFCCSSKKTREWKYKKSAEKRIKDIINSVDPKIKDLYISFFENCEIVEFEIHEVSISSILVGGEKTKVNNLNDFLKEK